MTMNKEIKIAQNLTIKNWEDLEKKLKTNYNNNWDEAYKFFELRICSRYLKPINSILELKPNNGKGFAVVNLQCSLIEMIESFINGWIYKYPNFINQEGKPFKGNQNIFKSFFDNRSPFKKYHPKINGNLFYVDVRCGLLHETQTKNNWKIKKDTANTKLSYVENSDEKIIYRENFQRDLELLIDDYKKAIINGLNFDNISACELRKNFISKFNHICKESQ